jgi:hypothetical protein
MMQLPDACGSLPPLLVGGDFPSPDWQRPSN